MMQGYRKLSFALASVASASILAWFGKIDAGVYSTVMVTAIGGYLASNVWAKVQAGKQG